MWHKRFQAMRDDEGVAMVLVVGFTITMALLLAVAFSITTTSLRSARQHTNFERAISVAEAGIDQTMGRLQHQYDVNRGDWPIPSSADPDCTGSPITAGAFTTDAAEKAQARTVLEGLVSSCTHTTEDGEYVVWKPSDRQVVYALAAVPSFGAEGAKVRLLKSEYLFSPFSPSHAVLTESNLCFSGSIEIMDVSPDHPADVHTNTDYACNGGTGTSGITVEGTLTASGSASVGNNANITGGWSDGQPKVKVPSVSPRTIYDGEHANYAGRWYDLCPDASVRRPSSAGPCQATAPADILATSGVYQGWTFDAGSNTWEMKTTPTTTSAASYAGVYYVYHSDVVVNAGQNPNTNPPAWNATVISEAASSGGPSASCGKLGGNIDISKTVMQNVMSGILLLADGDLLGGEQYQGAEGLLIANDQVQLHTSGHTTLTGAVIAGDVCPNASQTNDLQGYTINFTGNIEAPLTSVIRNVLWLEYVG